MSVNEAQSLPWATDSIGSLHSLEAINSQNF
jgi:hypothetical protein